MSTEEDATTQIQAALGTQDPSYIKSALSYYGETLRRGSSQARADLEVAEGYLEQLEAFAAAAAAAAPAEAAVPAEEPWTTSLEPAAVSSPSLVGPKDMVVYSQLLETTRAWVI